MIYILLAFVHLAFLLQVDLQFQFLVPDEHKAAVARELCREFKTPFPGDDDMELAKKDKEIYDSEKMKMKENRACALCITGTNRLCVLCSFRKGLVVVQKMTRGDGVEEKVAGDVPEKQEEGFVLISDESKDKIAHREGRKSTLYQPTRWGSLMEGRDETIRTSGWIRSKESTADI
jgi:hypothetical protein